VNDSLESNDPIQFYENKFSSGYMEEWPNEKKKRIFNLIQSLGLPDTGKALDFGCGNGVFTEVLIEALPKWEIYGADISTLALSNAKKNVPAGKFYPIEHLLMKENKFDFLFSHHVLEHVFNIDQTFSEISSMMNSIDSSMLHVLPCGNKGSLEYEICAARDDGIDSTKGNLFFFEDIGHVRRFTSDLLTEIVQNHGYKLKKESYANQHIGALRWIAHSGLKFILGVTETNRVSSVEKKMRMSRLRLKLIFLSIMTKRIRAFYLRGLKNKKKMKDFLICLLSIPFFIFWPVYFWLENQSELEWKHRRSDRCGSEMFLYFTKADK